MLKRLQEQPCKQLSKLFLQFTTETGPFVWLGPGARKRRKVKKKASATKGENFPLHKQSYILKTLLPLMF